MITDDNNNANFINDAIITPAPVIANVSMRIGDRVDKFQCIHLISVSSYTLIKLMTRNI